MVVFYFIALSLVLFLNSEALPYVAEPQLRRVKRRFDLPPFVDYDMFPVPVSNGPFGRPNRPNMPPALFPLYENKIWNNNPLDQNMWGKNKRMYAPFRSRFELPRSQWNYPMLRGQVPFIAYDHNGQILRQNDVSGPITDIEAIPYYNDRPLRLTNSFNQFPKKFFPGLPSPQPYIPFTPNIYDGIDSSKAIQRIDVPINDIFMVAPFDVISPYGPPVPAVPFEANGPVDQIFPFMPDVIPDPENTIIINNRKQFLENRPSDGFISRDERMFNARRLQDRVIPEMQLKESSKQDNFLKKELSSVPKKPFKQLEKMTDFKINNDPWNMKMSKYMTGKSQPPPVNMGPWKKPVASLDFMPIQGPLGLPQLRMQPQLPVQLQPIGPFVPFQGYPGPAPITPFFFPIWFNPRPIGFPF